MVPTHNLRTIDVHMIKLTRYWVKGRFANLWEEMSGISRTFPARMADDYRPGPKPPVTPVDLDYARRWIPFSELNAARLIHRVLEDRITYLGSETAGHWYFYNEVYHAEVEDGIPLGDWVAEAFADEIVRAMDAVSQELVNTANARVAANAATNFDTEMKKLRNLFRDHFAYQQKLHSEAGLNALKARFRKQCSKGTNHFENDRRWLVCLNGVIDLDGFRKTYTVKDNFRDLNPDFAVNRAVQCKFNPEAKAPNWEHFLETSIPDEEIREFLQRLVGAAFLAESKVKAIPNLQGPKDCGKTIFVSTLERLAGGYGIQPSPNALMDLGRGSVNFEQERLRGARFVGISEPNPHAKLDDSFCKQVTGGDEVSTRTLHKASKGWLPQCVIFIASNQPVNFNTSDQAFVERICLVQFPHRFYDASELPEGDWHLKDYDLERKLEEEYEGIFLWVIMGMWKYLVHGIGKPESVKQAGDAFVIESSGPLSWLAEKVYDGHIQIVEDVSSHPMSHYVTLNKIYGVYQMDMMYNSERPLSKSQFKKQLAAKFGTYRSGAIRFPGVLGVGEYAHLKDASNSVANDMGL